MHWHGDSDLLGMAFISNIICFELGCAENLKLFMGSLFVQYTGNLESCFSGRRRWFVPSDEFAELVFLLSRSELKKKSKFSGEESYLLPFSVCILLKTRHCMFLFLFLGLFWSVPSF